MNVETGTEAAQFPDKEYINGIFVAVYSDDDLHTVSPMPRAIGFCITLHSSWHLSTTSMCIANVLKCSFLHNILSILSLLYKIHILFWVFWVGYYNNFNFYVYVRCLGFLAMDKVVHFFTSPE
jgi:hypothetical protein